MNKSLHYRSTLTYKSARHSALYFPSIIIHNHLITGVILITEAEQILYQHLWYETSDYNI